MKHLNLFLTLLLCFGSLSAQSNQPSAVEITYLDIHPSKIGTFVKLHKEVSDMAMGDDRTIQDSWVYRHWYGSGASVMIMDVYATSEDALKDDFRAAIGNNMKDKSEKEKEAFRSVFQEWWTFFDGHWDEMRVYNPMTDFVSKENVDWDIPFVFVVGSYNTTGNMREMANAYTNWQTRPHVENGLQLGGGFTTHFKGSGADVQFFGGFKNIKEFAETISTQSSDNPEDAKKFWDAVSGSHEDQIYVHVGHLENGVFNLAGKDK
jgi:hypothetical protein